MAAPEIHDARPVLLVRDIDATLSYYRDQLGFNTVAFGDPPNFASASRGSATVLFALHDEPTEIVPNWRLRPQTWNVYIGVANVDALYDEFQDRGAVIDYSLYDAPHGFREFGTKTPMATTSPSVSRSADVADGGSHVYGEDLPYLVGDRG